MPVRHKIEIEVSDAVMREVSDALARGEIETWDELIEQALYARWERSREPESPEEIARMRRLVDEALADNSPRLEGNFDAEDIHRRGMERLRQKQLRRA